MKHGHTVRGKRTATYVTWQNMINRCTDPENEKYPRYGGRGILVCERWLDFASFLADMGEAPPGTQIDRLHYDGNYEKSNCRWASRAEQMNNMSTNRPIAFNGVTRNLEEWSRLVGVTSSVIRKRLNRGWSVERALFTKQGLGSNQFTSKPKAS
jgi:hypothetical protein